MTCIFSQMEEVLTIFLYGRQRIILFFREYPLPIFIVFSNYLPFADDSPILDQPVGPGPEEAASPGHHPGVGAGGRDCY
jgi:hypothetical protein